MISRLVGWLIVFFGLCKKTSEKINQLLSSSNNNKNSVKGKGKKGKQKKTAKINDHHHWLNINNFNQKRNRFGLKKKQHQWNNFHTHTHTHYTLLPNAHHHWPRIKKIIIIISKHSNRWCHWHCCCCYDYRKWNWKPPKKNQNIS